MEYDPAWPAAFEEIACPIREAVANLPATVEHVGSTAVPGLAAKPIIDVDVVVACGDAVPGAIVQLRGLGYVHEGDLGVLGREAFRCPTGARPHHLYVVVSGSRPHRDHIEFRDHLRANPDAAAEYARVKREFANRHRGDRVAYSNAKSRFVEAVLRRARP